MTDLVPLKATFAPGEEIVIEVRGGEPDVSLWHLDRRVATVASDGGEARFAAQPEGGYGVTAGDASTAVDVLANPLARARYGFVASYPHGRDVAGVVDNVRRLHLNAVQFYDWMYRHAKLVPPTDVFEDALGQTVSLDTSRRLASALEEHGSLPMAYAAVYAVGRDEWPEWESDGLFHPDGTPWTLGDDFLWNVDITSDRWLAHFVDDLREALQAGGFAGFHLDQYGQPKRALRKDGTVVDLAVAFPALLERLARDVPDAQLIFNNVNDFPTWATAPGPQAATYIEVWAPHVRLQHLAELVTKARSFAPQQAVIIAAYLSVYANGSEEEAMVAERLQHAVVLSHGGTVLLHGEERNVLTEAYYVSNHTLGAEAAAAARRTYDFAVRYGDLLFDPGDADVTRMVAGGLNQEIRVEASVPVATDCEAGALWLRIVETSAGRVVHLIDLSNQDNDEWDAPKRPARPLEGVRLAVERDDAGAPTIAVASPEQPGLQTLQSTYDGHHDVVELPAFGPWCLVLIR
ncbi:MAG TPA: glycoside hydrolase family 66 protein [Gaiellaceae bacterium]|jgi:dextranase|nr:glycoside hydrolase family 66 protein [Gaiellaceae bacterium]